MQIMKTLMDYQHILLLALIVGLCLFFLLKQTQSEDPSFVLAAAGAAAPWAG